MGKFRGYFKSMSTTSERFSELSGTRATRSCLTMPWTISFLHFERYCSSNQRLLFSDLNVLLSAKSLNNQRTIFERMRFSFLRILTTFGDEYEIIIQILVVAFDKDPSLLKSFDGLTDQYEIERIKNKTPHPSAYKEVKSLNLMKQVLELSIDVGSSSQNINNTLKGY